MQRLVGLEDEVNAEGALQLLEDRIAGMKRRVDDRIDADDDVLPLVEVADLHQLAPDLESDRGVRLDPPRPAAVRTRLRQRSLQRLADAFARHLDQAEFGDLQDLGLRAVFLDLVLQRLEEARAVLRIFHVDEVEDDDPAEVAEPDLADDLFRRFEVRPKDRLLEILLADVLAGVDVDRDECLGLVDHDVAARLEPHL